MPIAIELSRIITKDLDAEQVIYLKEVGGTRGFPMLIGEFEAKTIERRVKGFVPPRPLTHDLIVSIVEHLGGQLQDVVITELKDQTYYARLRIRHNGELIAVDCRPSDAIAVSLCCNPRLPLYIEEDVLNDVLRYQQ